MSSRIREHLRSNVVGYVAIFLFAVGGTAIAANTVRTEDIVNGEVHSIDVANNNLQGVDVRNDSLTGSDVVEDTLGTVPSAAGVAKNGVRGPAIAPRAVTPTKLSGFPAASVMRLSPETSHTAQGMTLHADYEFFDTDDLHGDGSETLVAPVTGTYFVSATVEWDPNGTGYRRTSIVSANGGSFASEAGPPLPAPAYTSQNVSGFELLQAGQSVHVEVLQGSSADLNVRLARFQMTLVGKS